MTGFRKGKSGFPLTRSESRRNCPLRHRVSLGLLRAGHGSPVASRVGWLERKERSRFVW